MTKRKPKSDLSDSIHEVMSDLHAAGGIDKTTMRKFDELCLLPAEPMTAKQIKSLRERERLSQAVFAAYLNVQADTVSKWEQGRAQPTGAATRLLQIVKRDGAQTLVA